MPAKAGYGVAYATAGRKAGIHFKNSFFKFKHLTGHLHCAASAANCQVCILYPNIISLLTEKKQDLINQIPTYFFINFINILNFRNYFPSIISTSSTITRISIIVTSVPVSRPRTLFAEATW